MYLLRAETFASAYEHLYPGFTYATSWKARSDEEGISQARIGGMAERQKTLCMLYFVIRDGNDEEIFESTLF